MKTLISSFLVVIENIHLIVFQWKLIVIWLNLVVILFIIVNSLKFDWPRSDNTYDNNNN